MIDAARAKAEGAWQRGFVDGVERFVAANGYATVKQALTLKDIATGTKLCTRCGAEGHRASQCGAAP